MKHLIFLAFPFIISSSILAKKAPLWHANSKLEEILNVCSTSTGEDKISSCSEVVRRYSKKSESNLSDDVISAITFIDSKKDEMGINHKFINHDLLQLKGLVALKNNDITAANQLLIESAFNNTDSIHLKTLGGNFALASSLFKKGETKSIILYIQKLIEITQDKNLKSEYKMCIEKIQAKQECNLLKLR